MKLELDKEGVPLPRITFVCKWCKELNVQIFTGKITCGACNTVTYFGFENFDANVYKSSGDKPLSKCCGRCIKGLDTCIYDEDDMGENDMDGVEL